MKKIFSLILALVLSFNISCTWVFAKTKNYFIVTAYYSPLPNQNYYLKWNYEDEIRLNWKWIAWASWKWVFPWMLAAPSNYKFWTKVYLEWLWIWSIEDRGWAIVNAWKRWYEYDRLDVWMWYWDEWLRRALAWWKRKVVWNVIASSSQVSINLTNIESPMWATSNLKKIPNIFKTWIWKKSSKELITKLQDFLLEINFYNWEIDWIYNNELIDLIYDFQINNNLIKNWNLYWAWYWWTKTRDLFLKKYLNWDFDIKNELFEDNNDTIDKILVLEKQYKIFELYSYSKEENIQLQELMQKLWLYNWELSWVYNDLIDSIYDFQVLEWILSSPYTAWAWSYGPKTRQALKNRYDLYMDEQEIIRIEEERLKEEKLRQELRKIELEEKFKILDELSFQKTKKDLSMIWIYDYWEISVSVRELQLQLKELGYFDNKDTAIYWDITKQSVLKFQIDNWIVLWEEDLWAWIFWNKTKDKMFEIVKNNYLDELIKKEQLDKEELISFEII